jgi:Interferon-induced transmembrane protein
MNAGSRRDDPRPHRARLPRRQRLLAFRSDYFSFDHFSPEDSAMSYATAQSSRPPQNYLVWSVIGLVVSIISCCLTCYTFPAIGTAIAALVFSSKVNSSAQAGDMDGAQRASRNAKLWNLITLGLFLAGCIFAVVMFFALGGLEGQMNQWKDIQEAIEKAQRS